MATTPQNPRKFAIFALPKNTPVVVIFSRKWRNIALSTLDYFRTVQVSAVYTEHIDLQKQPSLPGTKNPRNFVVFSQENAPTIELFSEVEE